ncbi:hypothetical protein PSPO01_14616 [Paraphaeosphaeria sporulosa]
MVLTVAPRENGRFAQFNNRSKAAKSLHLKSTRAKNRQGAAAGPSAKICYPSQREGLSSKVVCGLPSSHQAVVGVGRRVLDARSDAGQLFCTRHAMRKQAVIRSSGTGQVPGRCPQGAPSVQKAICLVNADCLLEDPPQMQLSNRPCQAI